MSPALKPVATPEAPAAIGPYSQAVVAGHLAFVSGQLGLDPATGELPGDFVCQAAQAMKNLQAIVEAAGSSLEQVVSVDVFLTDMGRFRDFNEVYAAFFDSHKPARAAIGVAALPRDAQVEVRCVALVKG